LPEAADSPSTADRALLRSLRAWGGDDVDRAWARLAPAWRDRLTGSRPLSLRESVEDAWDALRSDQAASTGPDIARVHPSWFVRALKCESPAVRLAVAANAPEPIREHLRIGLGLDPGSFAAASPADPEALRWALALWSERLVGDVAERPDDPPVVVALSRLSHRDLARLVKVAGLAKHAFAIQDAGPSPADEGRARFSPLDRVRLGYFRRHIRQADRRLVRLARLDLEVIGEDRRRGHARLGLVTFGRLLASAEPHRARWAIQHIPYPVARLMRTRGTTRLSPRTLAAWENWVLEAAWARLLSEGRLSDDRKGPAR